MGLIIPNTNIRNVYAPLIFLLGPIRGTPNWQDDAVEYILSRKPNFIVASPRRERSDKISQYIISGRNNGFSRQRAWERHYLDIAKRNGCGMFWLPGETEHNCDKSYGAMTREELGMLMTNYKYDKSTRFCIGTDGKFSEFDTIKYDLSLDAPDKKIFSTLEETCDAAIRIAME